MSLFGAYLPKLNEKDDVIFKTLVIYVVTILFYYNIYVYLRRFAAFGNSLIGYTKH